MLQRVPEISFLFPSLPPTLDMARLRLAAHQRWLLYSQTMSPLRPALLRTGSFGRKSLKSIRNYAASCREVTKENAHFPFCTSCSIFSTDNSATIYVGPADISPRFA